MNKKNAVLVNAAIMGLFVASGVSTVQAGGSKKANEKAADNIPSSRKECKAAEGTWKDGSCMMGKVKEEAKKAMDSAKCAEGKCAEGKCGGKTKTDKAKGESKCGESGCGAACGGK